MSVNDCNKSANTCVVSVYQAVLLIQLPTTNIEHDYHIRRQLNVPKSTGDVAAGGSSAVATIAPVMQHQHVEAAVVGLSNMLNGGGAILGCSFQDPDQSGSKQSSSGNNNGSQLSVQLGLVIKGHGTLLLYSNRAPSSVTAELGSLPFDYDQAKGRLTVSLAGEHLQQDVVVSW